MFIGVFFLCISWRFSLLFRGFVCVVCVCALYFSCLTFLTFGELRDVDAMFFFLVLVTAVSGEVVLG